MKQLSITINLPIHLRQIIIDQNDKILYIFFQIVGLIRLLASLLMCKRINHALAFLNISSDEIKTLPVECSGKCRRNSDISTVTNRNIAKFY